MAKIYKENGEAIPAWIVQDDVTGAPAGYTITTDIVEIDTNCVSIILADVNLELTANGAIGVRSALDVLMAAQGGFALLDADEQLVMARWGCATEAERDGVPITEAQQEADARWLYQKIVEYPTRKGEDYFADNTKDADVAEINPFVANECIPYCPPNQNMQEFVGLGAGLAATSNGGASYVELHHTGGDDGSVKYQPLFNGSLNIPYDGSPLKVYAAHELIGATTKAGKKIGLYCKYTFIENDVDSADAKGLTTTSTIVIPVDSYGNKKQRALVATISGKAGTDVEYSVWRDQGIANDYQNTVALFTPELTKS